jgi:hypothetical protein
MVGKLASVGARIELVKVDEGTNPPGRTYE